MKLLLFVTTFFFTVSFGFAQETILIEDDFSDNSQNWYETDSENIKSEVKNGVYYLKNKTTSSRWIYSKLSNIDPYEEDFTIEMKIRAKSGDKNVAYGMLFSMYNDDSSFRQFFVTGKGDLKINHYYSEEDHKKINYEFNEAINKGYNYNNLKVVKTANILTYFINDKMVYRDGDNSWHGYKFAFFTGGQIEIEVDYLKITKSPRLINLVENAEKINDKVKLSDKINSEHTELSPIISPDGKRLFINRDNHPQNTGDANDDQDIWFSTMDQNGEWTALKNFGKPLNNTGKNFTVSLSPDNNSIVVANEYEADGSAGGQGLSISYKTATGWSIPTAFEIEDYYNDNDYVSYFLCADNKTLLMAVERKDSEGEKDLYVSFLKSGNKWTKPKQMGNVINSFGDESKPFLAADNKTLYFSSTGHQGYGYDDIFVSKRLDDSWTNWSEPKNLGPKVNSNASELGYLLDAKGEWAYLSSGGDIWKIENLEKPEAVTLVSGIVYNKKTNQPIEASIKYYDLETNTELGIAKSDPTTGEYKIVLPSGKNYSFIGEQKGFYPISENLNIKESKEYQEITKNLYLLPIEKGEVIRLNNIFFEFNKADLMSESFNELDRLYDILKSNKGMSIEIGGHTDDKGSDEYNKTLSNSRAKSVVDYLVNKGIDASRLTSVGYGESSPVVPNDTDDNRAYNRRVEFKVL